MALRRNTNRRPTDADYAALLLLMGEPPQWSCKREPVTAARIMTDDDREQQAKWDNALGKAIAFMRLESRSDVTRTGFFQMVELARRGPAESLTFEDYIRWYRTHELEQDDGD